MAESAQSQSPPADGINAENNHLPGDPIVNVNRPRNNTNTNNANNNGNQQQQQQQQQQQPVRRTFIYVDLKINHFISF
jgi:hypothetical protein